MMKLLTLPPPFSGCEGLRNPQQVDGAQWLGITVLQGMCPLTSGCCHRANLYNVLTA